MSFPSRTEIVTAMKNPPFYKATEMQGGNPVRTGTNLVQYAGGFTTVFPFIKSDGSKVAVRCWCADIGNARMRSHAISEYLKNNPCPYFVNFHYIDNALLVAGQLQPVVIMDWVEGKTLKDYISTHLDSQSISELADKFKDMVAEFHRRNIAHGDLQHGNIMVKADGSLVVVDYDSMYIDTLQGMDDVIKGLPGYQHPARIDNREVNPKLDYFSELVIYLSLLILAEMPDLQQQWQKYNNTEDLLFSRTDFTNIRLSSHYQVFHLSSNQLIVRLFDRICEFLSKNDIQELVRLEEAIKDPNEGSKEEIAVLWGQQPNPPQPPVVPIVVPGTSTIADSWNKQPAPQQIELPSTNDIASSWNKPKSNQRKA
jgi:serine/threonine protein kinase